MLNDVVIEGVGVRGVVLSAACSDGFIEYLKSVDISAICAGAGFTMIKDGTTTTVGVLDCLRFGMDFNVVVKRFNHRGFIDALLKKTFGSRARRLYLKTIELFGLAIGVPSPIAFIEGRDGKTSYFISRYMEGCENMAVLFKEGLVAKEDRMRMMRSVAEAIANLHMAGVTHGDMKWSNILIDASKEGSKVVFVDNDQASIEGRPLLSSITKDLVRFYRYGLELEEAVFVDDEFFDTYIRSVSDKVNTDGLQASVVSKAVDEFSRKN